MPKCLGPKRLGPKSLGAETAWCRNVWLPMDFILSRLKLSSLTAKNSHEQRLFFPQTDMAKVQESRFALLHVEDDSDEESTPVQTKKSNQPVKVTQKKQKSKKKKTSQTQAENEEVSSYSNPAANLGKNFM